MNFAYEKIKISQGHTNIVGCDEVGRGSLAGPVVAAAIILNPKAIKTKWYSRVKDSKQLSAQMREELEPLIKTYSLAWAIGLVSPEKIDALNIHNASLLAMQKAVNGLLQKLPSPIKSFVCVDGRFNIPNINLKQEAVIRGDDKILSIAAASIVAKVYRDTLMKRLDKKYPKYYFAQHKGYATKMHVSQIKTHGLSQVHRLSFCGNII